ncbi:protease inhibitor I42 family protein [Bradyrhizobium sp. Ec3.3]|uniref:protease inhibitor I42 family protein n=1 Tax=Bradyrhizobium sp. Ec3.3 TaxID=189753 RepID=UPI000425C771|nr:protease inhibitor I42 family protein [Bradyrhizobium sp. Ec3.3]
MSNPENARDSTISGVRRGEEFEVVLPNFATAGFQWKPDFEQARFILVGLERRGEGRHEVVFRFRALGADGKIQFMLARPGKEPRETRTYNVIVGP